MFFVGKRRAGILEQFRCSRHGAAELFQIRAWVKKGMVLSGSNLVACFAGERWFEHLLRRSFYSGKISVLSTPAQQPLCCVFV